MLWMILSAFLIGYIAVGTVQLVRAYRAYRNAARRYAEIVEDWS